MLTFYAPDQIVNYLCVLQTKRVGVIDLSSTTGMRIYIVPPNCRTIPNETLSEFFRTTRPAGVLWAVAVMKIEPEEQEEEPTATPMEVDETVPSPNILTPSPQFQVHQSPVSTGDLAQLSPAPGLQSPPQTDISMSQSPNYQVPQLPDTYPMSHAVPQPMDLGVDEPDEQNPVQSSPAVSTPPEFVSEGEEDPLFSFLGPSEPERAPPAVPLQTVPPQTAAPPPPSLVAPQNPDQPPPQNQDQPPLVVSVEPQRNEPPPPSQNPQSQYPPVVRRSAPPSTRPMNPPLNHPGMFPPPGPQGLGMFPPRGPGGFGPPHFNQGPPRGPPRGPPPPFQQYRSGPLPQLGYPRPGPPFRSGPFRR